MAAPSASATQQFVPIKEIRNGIIVLKDGSYRGILICSSINFGLKSADEQHAITLGFQNFLNTLDFSIQIVVNSRKMDLRPYLALLEEKDPTRGPAEGIDGWGGCGSPRSPFGGSRPS